MRLIAEGEDSFLRPGFFLVPSAAAKCGGKTVFVQRLLQGLCLHDVRVGGSMVEWVNSLTYAFLVSVDKHLDALFPCDPVAKLNQIHELPCRGDR